MKHFMLIIILFVFLSCDKQDNRLQPNFKAEVIKYDSRKAYCIYGWYLKIGKDTILSFSDKIRTEIGFLIDKPIKVHISAKPLDCGCKTPIYEIISIEKYD